jgi:hypothetical protein
MLRLRSGEGCIGKGPRKEGQRDLQLSSQPHKGGSRIYLLMSETGNQSGARSEHCWGVGVGQRKLWEELEFFLVLF